MVGLFSRFSGERAGHRRSPSALDEEEAIPPNTVATESAIAAASRGIEITVEFNPIEHPVEPLDNDQPVRCPLPEPSILNDGRIWKERLSANATRRTDLPVVKTGSHFDSEGISTRPKPRTKRLALPSSISAPEHNLIALLDRCNVVAD